MIYSTCIIDPHVLLIWHSHVTNLSTHHCNLFIVLARVSKNFRRVRAIATSSSSIRLALRVFPTVASYMSGSLTVVTFLLPPLLAISRNVSSIPTFVASVLVPSVTKHMFNYCGENCLWPFHVLRLCCGLLDDQI